MNPHEIDISMIIVNWNTKQYLLDCVDSLKKESRRAKIEIIVVDNGSRDGSQEALRLAHPDAILIENGANYGFAKANNIGIAVARGRYVCLVNSDIIALDSCPDRLLEYLDAHPEAGVAGPKTLDEHRKLRPNCRRFPTIRNTCADYLLLHKLFPRVPAFQSRTLDKSAYGETRFAEVLSGCFFMVRRDALEEVGPLDERFFFYGEDTDWCMRFRKAGWKIVFYIDAVAIHFLGKSSSAYPVRYAVAMEKADLQYWRKHHSAFVCEAYALIKGLYRLGYGIVWLLIFLFRASDRKTAWLKTSGHFACLALLAAGGGAA